MTRVLVVDDEEIQLRGTSLGLRREGFEVEVARGADDALAALSARPFDVVLVDLMMPKMNGLELARVVRERFAPLPVVLTSAYPLSRRQIDRLGLGEVAFVPKPSPVVELARKLRAVVSNDPALAPNAALPPAPAGVADSDVPRR
jgi:CheY-like chemotaxis protein